MSGGLEGSSEVTASEDRVDSRGKLAASTGPVSKLCLPRKRRLSKQGRGLMKILSTSGL